MMATIPEDAELLLVNEILWVLTAPVSLGSYHFPFTSFFPCRHAWHRPERVEAVARVGVVPDYARLYHLLLEDGIALVHTPEEYLRCSELPRWYPLLEGLTPKSLWFQGVPDLERITAEFQWPIFMKGARQTRRHRRDLSIIHSPEHFKEALEIYASDPILHWQEIVCREFVPLRPAGESGPDQIPSSFEFRTFWWKGELVGAGPYWWGGKPYHWTEEEKYVALEIAREAARRVGVTFLVIDAAQTIEGNWIVIECNDGQESGYAGVSPFALWQAIIEKEKG